MTKNKRKKLNNDTEPMEVDEDVNISNGGETEKNGEANGAEDECDDHISEDEEGGFRIAGIYVPPPSKPALTFDATGPRLIISHVINENFKSYAETQYLGPFHKSFTAIIGPNGSGKSNVIDSMLFVFGYRASKIRSKKISVLIHSSSKFPNCQSCTVSVHFCQIIDGPGESFDVVPNSEIVVSRTAFKDNSSFYTLNGRRVQFKEVAAMLRSHGIDLDHNRFLILQGEVEQIAMMKPKALTPHDFGMLEYLEDIIGTSRYKEPIEKFAVRVEELTEKRKEKLNRVRLVESEKTSLEQPMKEAVDLMNLSNQMTVNRNLLLQKYIYEVKKMSREKEDLKAKTENELKELEEKVAAINKEIEEKNAIIREGSQKMDALQKEKDEIKARLSEAKKKTVNVQSDITMANKKTKNLRQLIEQEQSKLIEYQLIPEKNAKEIEDCEKLLVKHNENKVKADEEMEAILAGVREQTRGLTEARDRHSAKLSGLQRKVDEAKSAHDLAQKQLKIYLSAGQKDMEQLEKAKTAYSNAKTQLEEKKQIKAQLTSSLPQQEKDLEKLQTKLRNYKLRETEMASEVRILRSQVEESTQAMTANRSRNRVLDSLMKEKRNGNLPGIYGRLGDLGGIDMKYDVAISTGCGVLDYIVVDNVDTATECVEYLKKNDVGRANFLALDKQMHLIEVYKKKQKFPENVPRMFDLITVSDERVLPAFYYALRDTLVANDLDQATRIAYGATRYRVVTLKGDLIEIAGTMSGGGKSVCRGRMGTSVQEDTRDHDPAVLQANEKKLEELNKSLIENRTQQKAMETEINTLQTTVQEGKQTLDKVNYDLNSLTELVPTAKSAVKDLERKVAASTIDEDRKTDLESIIERAKEQLDIASANAGVVEKEREEVDAQIMALSGTRVKEAQKKVNDLSNKINKVTTEISKLKVAINTSKRNALKSTNQIAQMETDCTETARNLEKYGELKKQLTLENAELQKKLDEVEEKLSECPSEFSGVKKEKAKLEDKVNKIKSQIIDTTAEIKKIKELIEDYNKKTPTWEKELKKLKLETIEPDESGITIAGLEAVEPLKVHTDEELEEVNIEELRGRVNAQKQRLGDKIPNTNAVLEYRAKQGLYLQRAADLELITNKRNESRTLYDTLKKRRQTDFLAGFNIITGKLKEMYQMITLGGDAELELVDSLDPFTEGIIFSVRPPNKSWKNISNLSGGEKTLSSLALVFALHYYKPTPLYVMDEIDAALDFKNVSIVANYIKERTKNAQFIIISLRYIMFETSNRLVGIYKVDDCTQCVCVGNVKFNKEGEQTEDDIEFNNLIQSIA